MPASRRQTLFFAVPVCLVLGIFGIVSEIQAHGLSAAVVAGLLGGVFAAGALLALIVPRWHRQRSRQEKAETARLWARTRPVAVSLGLLAAGVASAIGAVVGDSANALGSFAMVGFGVVFLVVAVLVATMAITRADLWD